MELSTKSTSAVSSSTNPLNGVDGNPTKRKKLRREDGGIDQEEGNSNPPDEIISMSTSTTAKTDSMQISKATASFFAPRVSKPKTEQPIPSYSSEPSIKKEKASSSSAAPSSTPLRETKIIKSSSSASASALLPSPPPSSGRKRSAPQREASATADDVFEEADDDVDSDEHSSVFHPVKDAWENAVPGKPVPYSALVAVFSKIEATTKRLEIQNHLSSFLRSVIAITPEDVLPALYLCTNSIAPAYANIELGVGDSLLVKALSEATGRQPKDIKSDAADKGDLGLVAESSRSRQKTIFGSGVGKVLTIRAVFAEYKAIAHMSGHSSQESKVNAIKKLLVVCQGPEAKYIIRSLQGKLRIGLAAQTVTISLAHAFVLTTPLSPGSPTPSKKFEVFGPPERGSSKASIPTSSSSSSSSSSAESAIIPSGPYPPVVLDTRRKGDIEGRLLRGVEDLKQVYSELPSFDVIVPHLLHTGIAGAKKACHLLPGIPVTPMLAKPTKGIGEVLSRFEGVKFTCEWKYDGERAQVHILDNGTVKIFSRNSEDTTSKYPDLGIALKMAMGRLPAEPIYPSSAAGSGPGAGSDADITSLTSSSSSSSSSFSARIPLVSCVLDGEAVAYDREKGQLLPFQILSSRQRKDATLDSIKVQVIFVAFDLLFLNGKSLLHSTLSQRREALRSSFMEVPGRFSFCTSFESTDTEEIGAFLNDSVKGGCEGLMVKVLDGPESVYEPSKRSLNWLKLKKDYLDGLSDSFDLVVIGAWRGKGKRTGVYGAYLLACYDPDNDEYQSVCKVGTGFSEEMLAQLTAAFDEKGCAVADKPSNVMAGESLDPDSWFAPEESEVWEVMAADLSVSPVHMGAVGKADKSKGIALRFPRFLRRRAPDDKGPEAATTSTQIYEMYRNQATVNNQGGEGVDQGDSD
jgi:DNA ligase 1